MDLIAVGASGILAVAPVRAEPLRFHPGWSPREAKGGRLPDRYRQLCVRRKPAPKTIRLTWPDGTIVIGYLTPKGPGKTQLAVTHTKLATKAAADAMKSEWAARLSALGALLT